MKLDQPKGACDGSTNLHLVQCGHQVFAGSSQSLATAASIPGSQRSVTSCGINCKIRGEGRPFLCMMCLLELAATSYDHLYDEAVQKRVARDTYKLLVTPLGRALRLSMPDLKTFVLTKTLGFTGFVSQLLEPRSNVAAIKDAVEEATAEAVAKVTGEVIEQPTETVNKPEQTLFVEQPGSDDVLARPQESAPPKEETGYIYPLPGHRPWCTRRVNTPVLSDTALIESVRSSSAPKIDYHRRTVRLPRLCSRSPSYRNENILNRNSDTFRPRFKALAPQNDEAKVSKPRVRPAGPPSTCLSCARRPYTASSRALRASDRALMDSSSRSSKRPGLQPSIARCLLAECDLWTEADFGLGLVE